MKTPPLAGRRVLVTRALLQAGGLSEGLRALGAEAIEVPVLEMRPPASFEPLDAALRQLDSYDWLILTSANTVRSLVSRATELGIAFGNSREHPVRFKVAAVGAATAAAARKVGLKIAFIPEAYIAESLVAGLLEGLRLQTRGLKILLARAAVARDVIPESMREAGVEVDVVDAYRNLMPEAAPKQLWQALKKGLDAATFTSSSSAAHLETAARMAGIAWPFAGVAAVSIGEVTSQTLRELGWEPAVEANPSDISGLIDAVVRICALMPELPIKSSRR